MSLNRKLEGIPWHTNAPMTVFVPEGTVVATGGYFFLFCVFYNTCQALLADQLVSSGMVARVCKLFTKEHHQKFKKKPPNIHKNTNIV